MLTGASGPESLSIVLWGLFSGARQPYYLSLSTYQGIQKYESIENSYIENPSFEV